MKFNFKGNYILMFWLVLIFTLPNISNAASFGVKPAYPREDNPRSESIFVQTINPGEFAQEGVKVINSTGEDKNLILYARDSVKSSGGGFACTQLSEPPKGVGSWVSFDISNLEEDIQNVKPGNLPNTIEIIIPKGTEILIPFKINVPKDASVGEHNGCVLIQEINQQKEETGVSLSLRSGIRVAVSVPGQVVRKLELSDFIVDKKNKSIYLRPSVKNIGNVSIDTQAGVKVSYFFGLPHKNFGGEFPVLRDEVYDFNFELKKPFWGGLYSARAVFTYDAGDNASIGVTSGEKPVKLKSERVWFFSTPTLLGLVLEIIIFFILLFGFAIWRLGKKKKKWIKKWVEYEVSKDETLESISKKNKVHWELLVEVNKLKPPYTLKEGQTIKIPPPRK